MNAQLDAQAGAILQAQRRAKLGIEVLTGACTTEILGKHAVTGVKLRRRPDDRRATWWWSPPASGPTPRWPRPAGWRSSAASWSTTRCARWTSRTSTRSASARSTAARCTAWSRRCGTRPRCSPTTSPARTRHAAYHGSRVATKLKVAGVDVASMGLRSPSATTTRLLVFAEPQQGRLQERHHPRRPAGRRDPGRRRQQGRVPDAGVRPRAGRCRRSGSSCCSTWAGRRPR